MAEFLSTDGINRKITEIISSAKNKLVFISPYLRLSATMIENISQASNTGIKVTFLYGKGELKAAEKKTLQSISNINLYYLPNLHAKCYFNEFQMLITSMNLYEYSQKNNREMGIAVDRLQDKELFENGLKEAKDLVSLSQVKSINSIPKIKEDNEIKIAKLFTAEQLLSGHCIRCPNEITHNPSRPLCPSCYAVWNEWGDVDYEENFCHSCGNVDDVTMRRPQCYSCYSKFNKKHHYR